MNIDNNKPEEVYIDLRLTYYKDKDIDPDVWRK